MEGHGMFSLDGEYIEFVQAVGLDGPVELWLNDVGNDQFCINRFIRFDMNLILLLWLFRNGYEGNAERSHEEVSSGFEEEFAEAR